MFIEYKQTKTFLNKLITKPTAYGLNSKKRKTTLGGVEAPFKLNKKMEKLIITISLIILFLVVLLWYTYNFNEKKRTITKDLFENKLIKLCYDAKTIEECNLAWDELMKDCIEDNVFKIHQSYIKTFYELRAILQGKIMILL